MTERVRERLAALPVPALRALQVLGALCVLAAGAVLVAVLLPGRSSSGPEPEKVLEDVRTQVQEDLSQAVLHLPPQVVRRLSEDGDGLQGTLAVRDGEACRGFRVEVGEGYVLDGDQGSVQVGPVEELPAESCLAALPTAQPAEPEQRTGTEPSTGE